MLLRMSEGWHFNYDSKYKRYGSSRENAVYCAKKQVHFKIFVSNFVHHNIFFRCKTSVFLR